MDLSIVDVADGVYEILATDGDLDLGGSTIDETIVNYIAEEFLKQEGTDVRKDPMGLQRLFEAAEKAKIELSNSNSADINIPYITAIDNVPKHLVNNLSKSKFNQLIEGIVDRTIDKAKSALKSSKLKVSDIREILLVGGSSRIPLVQEKLEEMFNNAPNKTLNPDTCVSTGATIQGGILSGDVSDILLLDVSPISLGIETMGGVTTVMIPSNTTIPSKKSEIFSTAQDNQPSVEIHILQGERSLAKDNKTIGRFHLDGIPPLPRGTAQIEVTFDVDSNGILSVSAQEKTTGKKQEIRIEGSTSLSEEEIERMRNEAKENEEADKKAKEEIETFNSAETTCFMIEKEMSSNSELLTEEETTPINELITSVKESISSKNVEEVNNKLKDLNEKYIPLMVKIQQTKENVSPDMSYEQPTEEIVEDVIAEEVSSEDETK